MGNVDRMIRVLIAAAIAILYFTNIITGSFGLILLFLGGIFAITSLIGSCPMYSILGISSCSVKNTAPSK